MKRLSHTILVTRPYTDEDATPGWEARKKAIADLSNFLLFAPDAGFKTPIEIRRRERTIVIDGVRTAEVTIKVYEVQ